MPFRPPPPLLLMLCASLWLAGCDSLRSDPSSPPPIDEQPVELGVTVKTNGTTFCRQGYWTVFTSLTGGQPEKVQLITDGQIVMKTLAPPYTHTVDCSTHAEGSFSFIVRAWAEGRSYDSPSVTVVVDRTPPRVQAWRPDRPYSSVNAPVEIIFSEPLHPKSLKSAPTLLRDGNGFAVSHQAVLSEDGTVLRLVFSPPYYGLPTTLHAELVQRNVTDRAGTPLAVEQRDCEKTFTYWSFAHVGPRLSRDDIGNLAFALRGPKPVIAFVENSTLVVARLSGTAWERLPSPRAEDERTRAIYSPLIEATPTGEVFLAWEEPGPQGLLVRLMRYDGTLWSRVVTPFDNENPPGSYKMMLGPDGHPVFVYRAGDGALRAMRYTGTTWKPLGGIINENQGPAPWASDVAIALDPGDSGEYEVVLAWPETNPYPNPRSVIVMRYQDGAWARMGAPVRGTIHGDASRVAIALRDNGPVVAWSESVPYSDDRFLFVSHWESVPGQERTGWSPPEDVLTPGMKQGFYPRIVIDKTNDAWVAWEIWGDDGYSSYFRRHGVRGWDPARLIGPSSMRDFRLDDTGAPWVLVSESFEWVILRPQ